MRSLSTRIITQNRSLGLTDARSWSPTRSFLHGGGVGFGEGGGQSKRKVDKTWICSTDGRPAFQTLVPLHKFIKDFHESSSFREIHLTSLEQIHILAFDFLPDGSRDYTFPLPCHFYRRSLPSCAQPTVAHLVFCFVLPFSFLFFTHLSPLSVLPHLPVMLLDTTESTSELGWTTYPDTGVSGKHYCHCTALQLLKSFNTGPKGCTHV